jgi:hypothetical protein
MSLHVCLSQQSIFIVSLKPLPPQDKNFYDDKADVCTFCNSCSQLYSIVFYYE